LAAGMGAGHGRGARVTEIGRIAVLDELRTGDWAGGAEPEDAAARVPTMLSGPERQLYRWLGRAWATGAGAIVDLGCFAGGSTARLAAGAAQAGHGARLHAYDRFTADSATRARVLPAPPPDPVADPAPDPVADPAPDPAPDPVPDPSVDRDILPLARAFLAPWAGQVRLHRGEIAALGWAGVPGGGGPIELLVVDAAKTAASADAIAAAFFPALISGASLVVQQDALHWRQPWIAAQMARLGPAFRPVAHVERDTIVWLCVQAPDAPALRGACVAGPGDAALDAALARAGRDLAGIAPPARLAALRAALAANPGVRAAHAMRPPS